MEHCVYLLCRRSFRSIGGICSQRTTMHQRWLSYEVSHVPQNVADKCHEETAVTDMVCSTPKTTDITFYSESKDETKTVNLVTLSPCPPVHELPGFARCCVSYITSMAVSFADVRCYYRYIVDVEHDSPCSTSERLTACVPTLPSFMSYCMRLRRHKVVNQGWSACAIQKVGCNVNGSGCFRCPLNLVRPLFSNQGTSCSIFPFAKEETDDRLQLYRPAWCRQMYESYTSALPRGHVLRMDFFSDGGTFSKSGTQRTTFVRVRFRNPRPFKEQWCTVGIAPNTASILMSLRDELRRNFKLQIYHLFLFPSFSNIIRASLPGFVQRHLVIASRSSCGGPARLVDNVILKKRDSDMDCTHGVRYSHFRYIASACQTSETDR